MKPGGQPSAFAAARVRGAAAVCCALAPVLALAQELHYDAQVAWLNAGTVDLSFDRDADRYELSGMVATSGTMNRFFRWQGRFAATGRFVAGYPTTEAYLLLEDDGETREALLTFKDTTTIHATDRDSKEIDRPPGSDLMSVTFLAPHCLEDGTVVHDGEDTYRVELIANSTQELRGPVPWFSGPTTRCDYRFREVGRRARRVSLWVGEVGGLQVPVRIRVRVPLFPDGVLRLRMGP